MKSVLAKFACLAITSTLALGGAAAHAGTLPTLSINDVSITEGNSGTKLATFTITLSAAQAGPVLVDVATHGSTAIAGVDYVEKSTAGLRIAAGSTSKTFAVTINGDTAVEENEFFNVNLSNPVGATLANWQGDGTIENDDVGVRPLISIADASVAEGNSGTKSMNFTVSLSAPASMDVTFGFSTEDGTAESSSDYYATTTLGITIPAGQTSKTISVPIVGDQNIEVNETFTVRLQTLSGADWGDFTAIGTIINDDTTPPVLNIADQARAEGNQTSTGFPLAITLSATNSSPISFDITTSDGTAKAGSDYTALTQHVTIPANSGDIYYLLWIGGDTTFESDETINVTLSNAVNATIGDGQSTFTILNDDVPPKVWPEQSTFAEGNSGPHQVAVEVRLEYAVDYPVTVDYATQDGTAYAGSDYVATSGTVTIPAGQFMATYNVTVNGDTTAEANEYFYSKLSNPVGATLDGDKDYVRISDDDGGGDAFPVLDVSNDVWVDEGDSGTKTADFTVTLSKPVAYDVTFNIDTTDVTASAGSDYVGLHLASQVIPAGTTTKTFHVTVNGDTITEGNSEENWEEFTLDLSHVEGATTGRPGHGYIKDDEGPKISVDDVSIVEGNSGTKTMTFTVSVAPVASVPVKFDIAAVQPCSSGCYGAAQPGSDFVAASQTGQTIPAGQGSKTFSVTINGDTEVEPDETFEVDLSNVTGATVIKPWGIGTITTDDFPPPPSIQIYDPVAFTEGNSGSQIVSFTVTYAPSNFNGPVSFDYSTADGTATAGEDYTAVSGHYTMPAGGGGSFQVQVPVFGDTKPEGNETFTVSISNVTAGVQVNDSEAVATIYNDDVVPRLSTSSVFQAEGNSGQANMAIVVWVDHPAASPITFDYTTVDKPDMDNPAFAGSDYVASSGSLTIAAGATTASFNVPIIGDTVSEPDETFSVRFLNVSGAEQPTSDIAEFITNDDAAAPSLSVADTTVTEGDSGTKMETFTVSLSAATDHDVSFRAATYNDTAMAGSDYVSAVLANQVIPAGATSKTIQVAIIGDTVLEPNERLSLYLDQVSGANITRRQASGWIVDNDVPTISVPNVSISEGNSGQKNMVFTATLSYAIAQDVQFGYATVDGTAVAGQDYWGASAVVTIPAGHTSATFSVPVIGDTTVEPDETISILLSDPYFAMLGNAQAIGTITNDDGAATPTLSIGDVSIAEGNSGTKTATFTVSLSAAASSTVSFDVATANGTATAGSDYVALSLTGQTIAAGQTSKTVSVTINGDTTVEPNETFNVNVTNVSGATVADGSAVGTITNDDTAGGPTLSIGDVTIAEGNSATKTATFTITLSAAQAGAVLVDVATANGTATAGSDYVAKTTTGLRIPAGSTSKTFLVTINGDTTAEPDETFTVNLSNASAGITIADGQGLGTITNDDAAATPTLSIADASIAEGNSGTKTLTFTVSLSPAASGTVTYNIATSNGTATAGSDYVASSLTGQTIAAGTTSKTFAVTINGDTTTEANETFNVTLTNVSGATLGDGTAVGTITNDDGATGPTLSIADVSVAEGNSLSKQVTFTVKLSAAASTAVTYNIATADGTALAPTDYTAKSLTGQSIAAGATTKTFTVAVKGDRTVEPNETFLVNVTNVAGATIADGQATGTITNDDASALTVARFDAKGLVDDVDDGNRQPQIAPSEYATLLADSASQLCRRAQSATVIAVEGIEHQRALADLADAANAICTGKPAYTAVMADADSRGFLIATQAKGEVGIEVLAAPEVNAAAQSTTLSILGAGHETPVTIMLANGSSKALATQLQQRAKAQPDEALVLLGANAANGLVDLTKREFGTAKAPLPAERVLVSAALLKRQPSIGQPPLPLNEIPAQLLELH